MRGRNALVVALAADTAGNAIGRPGISTGDAELLAAAGDGRAAGPSSSAPELDVEYTSNDRLLADQLALQVFAPVGRSADPRARPRLIHRFFGQKGVIDSSLQGCALQVCEELPSAASTPGCRVRPELQRLPWDGAAVGEHPPAPDLSECDGPADPSACLQPEEAGVLAAVGLSRSGRIPTDGFLRAPAGAVECTPADDAADERAGPGTDDLPTPAHLTPSTPRLRSAAAGAPPPLHMPPVLRSSPPPDPTAPPPLSGSPPKPPAPPTSPPSVPPSEPRRPDAPAPPPVAAPSTHQLWSLLYAAVSCVVLLLVEQWLPPPTRTKPDAPPVLPPMPPDPPPPLPAGKVRQPPLPDPLAICACDLELGPLIGKGGMGAVFCGNWLGSVVAVKSVRVSSSSACRSEALLREAAVLTRLRHPCICGCFGTVAIPQGVGLVLEYMPQGSLARLLRSARHAGIPIRTRLASRIGWEVAVGLAYVHRNNLMHRDVKPSNILLDEHKHAKLADFGLAIACDSRPAGPWRRREGSAGGDAGAAGNTSDAGFSGACSGGSAEGGDAGCNVSNLHGDGADEHTADVGTPRYMAPEVKGKSGDRIAVYTERCDVFSFGVLLYEMLLPNGRFEFPPGVSRKAPFARGYRPQLALQPDRKVFEPIISWCWQQEPSRRPLMSHIVTTCLRDACLAGCEDLRGDMY